LPLPLTARRWTTEKRLGYRIMDCELIVVPVHQEMHWVLAVINLKERIVSYLDSLKGLDSACQERWARASRPQPPDAPLRST